MSNQKILISLATLVASNFISPNLANSRTITIIGDRSCEQWIADRSLRNKVASNFDWISSAVSEAWLLGLMNGMNSTAKTEKDILYSADANLIYSWMDKYCKENNKSSIYDGSEKLLRKLEKNTEARKK